MEAVELKFTVRTRNRQLFVRVRLDSNTELSSREMECLSAGGLSGFLTLKRSKRSMLEFEGPQGVSLLQSLKDPMSESDFFYMMQQIVEAVKVLEGHRLFLKNLVLDMRYVFINQNTKELLFLYLPVVSDFRSVDMLGFIQSVVYSAAFMENRTDFAVQFMRYLKEERDFSVETLERYLTEKGIRIKPSSMQAGMFQEGTSLLSEYGSAPYMDEGTSLLTGAAPVSGLDEGTSLLKAWNPVSDIEDGTSLLATPPSVPEADEGTSLLVSNLGGTGVQQHRAYLIRSSTNEKIMIYKDVFTMGKGEKNVDYMITDNNAVSRIHADILTRGTRFFVMDHGATNKTYINGIVLPEHAEVELPDGAILKLANEEFVFHA